MKIILFVICALLLGCADMEISGKVIYTDKESGLSVVIEK